MLITSREIIKQSWYLYKNNLNLLCKISAWLLAPTVISLFLPISNLGVVGVPVNIILLAITMICSLFIVMTLTLTSGNILNNKISNLKNIYLLSYSKLISAIWISILMFLTCLVAFGIGMVPAILGRIFNSLIPTQSAWLLILTVPSVFLVLIFGAIAVVWIYFSLYLLIFENKKGVHALLSSREMTQNYFWAILWRLIIPNLFYWVIYFLIILILSVIFGVISSILGLNMEDPNFLRTATLSMALIINIIFIFLTPLFINTGVLLYNGLKKEKSTPRA